MVKRLNVVIPDELHKKLGIALAADETDFSKWVREHIEKYVEEAGKKHLSDYVGEIGEITAKTVGEIGEFSAKTWTQVVNKAHAQFESKSRKKKNPRGKKVA